METAVESRRLELVARERSGHTALVEDNVLYVWGGYVSISDEEVFLPSNEIWLYDLERGIWEMSIMEGEIPPSMSGTSGCCLNGEMYIFGGCDDNGQTNQLYCVNLHDKKYTWKKVATVAGSPPSPRDKLSCWVYKDRIIYFGGYGQKQLEEINKYRNFIIDEASWVEGVFFGWSNEVHVFDTRQTRWTEPKTSGRPPAPRAAHAGVTLGNKGYVCGGRVMEARRSDIYCLDLESWTWTEVVPESAVPVGRSWHTLTAISEHTFFLFGGLSIDCNPMSDGWIFDVETRRWTKAEHPYNNMPRLWHTACQGEDSDVIVFGGSCDYILLVDTGHCNDALIFQAQPHSLFRLCKDYIAKKVKSDHTLKKQLSHLPLKLRQAVERRMYFFREARKSHINQVL